MHESSDINQYVDATISSEAGLFRPRETPPRPTFAPPWIQPFEYPYKTTARMKSFQVMHVSPVKL